LLDAAVHAPAPLHTDAVVVEPLLQLAGVHCVPPPGKAHAVALAPSHAPAQGAVPVHLVRVPRGAPATVMHRPTLLLSPQLWHWPPHAVSQQKLSMQWPLVHSAAP
jgi:hypothetical protein